MRRAMLTAASGVVLPAIGDPFMGGYFAGIIDTTKGNIIAADASQTGLRYALIVAPQSLESSPLAYKPTDSAAPAAASTRWDGLTATIAMNSSAYPAAQWCYGQSYPTDDASRWYLPAMDELELIYRNLKPTTDSNYTSSSSGSTFPGGSQAPGYNPSSDPAGSAYSSSVPAQTSVAAFKSGGAQALGASVTSYYWSATEYSSSNAWAQSLKGGFSGYQTGINKGSGTRRVRPVRRLPL